MSDQYPTLMSLLKAEYAKKLEEAQRSLHATDPTSSEYTAKQVALSTAASVAGFIAFAEHYLAGSWPLDATVFINGDVRLQLSNNQYVILCRDPGRDTAKTKKVTKPTINDVKVVGRAIGKSTSLAAPAKPTKKTELQLRTEAELAAKAGNAPAPTGGRRIWRRPADGSGPANNTGNGGSVPVTTGGENTGINQTQIGNLPGSTEMPSMKGI